jgi:hypothetical protein
VALIVSIVVALAAVVAALAAVAAARYARRLDETAKSAARAAKEAAEAAAATAALDKQRRNAELTPHFRISREPSNSGSATASLKVFLCGPPELERLDTLTVTIRDDHPWRAQGSPLAGGPTTEQVAAQIWGPFRFVPSTGPGANSVRGIPGADATGRTTPTGGLPVGEELTFALERTQPPPWSQQSTQDWWRDRGTLVRLRLECRRDGWEPWVLTGEIDIIGNGLTTSEIP